MSDLGRKKHFPDTPNCIIEVYNYGHYFTVTENIYGEERGIESRTTEIEELYNKYFVETKKPKASCSPLVPLRSLKYI